MSQILERRAVQLTDLSTALDSIDSRTIGGYVVIKAVINQVQVPYSHSNNLSSIAAMYCMACDAELPDSHTATMQTAHHSRLQHVHLIFVSVMEQLIIQAVV